MRSKCTIFARNVKVLVAKKSNSVIKKHEIPVVWLTKFNRSSNRNMSKNSRKNMPNIDLSWTNTADCEMCSHKMAPDTNASICKNCRDVVEIQTVNLFCKWQQFYNFLHFMHSQRVFASPISKHLHYNTTAWLWSIRRKKIYMHEPFAIITTASGVRILQYDIYIFIHIFMW